MLSITMSEPNARRGSAELPAARPVPWRELLEVEPGAVKSRTLAKTAGGTLTAFAFDAGEGLSEHTAPFDAHVHVLDGRVELVIGGETIVAGPGELVRMPAHVPHALRALEPLRMLLVMLREPS